MKNTPATNKQHIAQARWLSALGEPTRIRIICALSAGEKTVTELVESAKTHMMNASKHLVILKSVGLVAAERDGQFKRYSLVGAEAIGKEMVLMHESGMRVFFATSGAASGKPAPKKPSAKKEKK